MQPVCQVRVHESGRFGQGSHRTAHDRGSGEEGSAEAGLHDHRAHVRKHRNRAGHGCRRQGLPMSDRHAGEDVQREGGHAQGPRSRGDPHPNGGGLRLARRTDRRCTAAREGDPQLDRAQPVHERRKPVGTLRRNWSGDRRPARRSG
uniref:(northern house mosquito) hypothetical protein n=1 Tax=Culex pipiens TaxID=7175 RepID=A0A8D8A548_CULPI